MLLLLASVLWERLRLVTLSASLACGCRGCTLWPIANFATLVTAVLALSVGAMRKGLKGASIAKLLLGCAECGMWLVGMLAKPGGFCC